MKKKQIKKRRPDDTDKLYIAAQKYVENRGGKLALIGGISIMQMPGDLKGKFSLVIHMLGKKPEPPNPISTLSGEV